MMSVRPSPKVALSCPAKQVASTPRHGGTPVWQAQAAPLTINLSCHGPFDGLALRG